MEKLNIAELLKDCPKGTKLYSPLVGECTLEHIHSELKKILISTSDGTTLTFNNNGTYFQMDNSECLLFPSKDQRDWSEFQTPFEDGDVISNGAFIAIFHKVDNGHMYYHCWYNPKYNEFKAKIDFGIGFVGEYKHASKEEKQKLFDVIEAYRYNWNPETKILEKLSKFKVGDRIILKDNPHNIPSIRIKAVTKSQYMLENERFFYIDSTDEKYVLEDKFDITTLKPFESRVLVRNHNYHYWRISFFGFFDKNKCVYDTIRGIYSQCIPYEGNEHLVGTTNDCNEYYKTW